MDTDGSYECMCNEGYSGNGTYCVGKMNPSSACLQFIVAFSFVTDINECSGLSMPPCDVNATCTNTIGSFACKCNTGYTGNRTTCTSMSLTYKQGQAYYSF